MKMKNQPTLVISYSHEDQSFVRPMIRLMRATLGVKHAVFWDDDFEPGIPWFAQLTEAIEAAQQLFVFWCGHAAASAQVQREYEYALSHGARVIPVLLDGTFEDGPAFVRDNQGIDFRGFTHHPDTSLYTARPDKQPPCSTHHLDLPRGGGASGDRRWSEALNRIADLLDEQGRNTAHMSPRPPRRRR